MSNNGFQNNKNNNININKKKYSNNPYKININLGNNLNNNLYFKKSVPKYEIQNNGKQNKNSEMLTIKKDKLQKNLGQNIVLTKNKKYNNFIFNNNINNINNNRINDNIINKNDNKLKRIMSEFHITKKKINYKTKKIYPVLNKDIFHRKDNLNNARIEENNKNNDESIDMNPANINIAELIGGKDKEDREYLIKNLIGSELNNVDRLEEENKECAICLEIFEKGNKIISLPCVHIYHDNCIKEWLLKKNFCPICKYEFTKDDFH